MAGGMDSKVIEILWFLEGTRSKSFELPGFEAAPGGGLTLLEAFADCSWAFATSKRRFKASLPLATTVRIIELASVESG